MANQWTLCTILVMMAKTGMAMPDPRRAASDDFLVNYIGSHEQLPQDPEEVPGWPSTDMQFGQVAGVDVSSDGVVIFHRGNRTWVEETIDSETNMMPENQRVTIPENTIVFLDRDRGDVIKSFGASSFYVPHGLTVDKEGNLWLTDVGAHQVYRIPHGKTEPDLVLGEKFIPGNDNAHFCKPTDVAVASNGIFFVSDGYCNARILKFSPSGLLIGKFGMDTVDADPNSPYGFNVPHSLSLIEELDILCVADRENQRVLCYNAGLGDSKLGQFNRTVVPGGDIGRVYALAYDHVGHVMYMAALLSQEPVYDQQGYPYSPARAFTYDLEGNFLGDWDYITPGEAEQGPSIRHDIAVSPDGNDVYVADVLQNVVRKFTAHPLGHNRMFR